MEDKDQDMKTRVWIKIPWFGWQNVILFLLNSVFGITFYFSFILVISYPLDLYFSIFVDKKHRWHEWRRQVPGTQCRENIA